MERNKRIIFPKSEVFDSNLMPYPFDRAKVITRDAFENPTVVEFYDQVIINSAISFDGRLLFTMYIKRTINGDWEDVAVKKEIELNPPT